MSYTPGPWCFSRFTEYGDVRFYVAQADGAPYTPNYSDVATLIAETVSSEWAAIQEANARLIAAAPELLAALKEIIPEMRGLATLSPLMQRYVDVCESAITKATGDKQ